MVGLVLCAIHVIALDQKAEYPSQWQVVEVLGPMVGACKLPFAALTQTVSSPFPPPVANRLTLPTLA